MAEREMGAGGDRAADVVEAEHRIQGLERALKEVLELGDGSAPAAKRLAQIRRRAAAALAEFGRATE